MKKVLSNLMKRKQKTMMKKLKKFLSASLAVMALSAVFPAMGAYADNLETAEDELSDGSFVYEEVDGGYAIKRCTASILTKFPGIVNGVTIVEIKDGAFAGCSTLTELKIPESVKKIGDNAFLGCTSLKSVTLPQAITKIPDNAFVDCTSLQEIVVSDHLTEVGDMAFNNCQSLSKINLPDGVTTIGDSAFDTCYSLTSFTLPDSLTEIGEMAFSYSPIETFDTEGCSAFKFTDGILYNKDETEIYRAAPSISGDVYIKDGVKEINGGAFSLCSGITNLFIPDSVETIGGYAFSECVQLKSVDFSEGLKTLGMGAFAYDLSLESVELPVSLETLGDGSFMVCQKLNKVIMQENLKSIGDNAFIGCTSLKQVTVPKSVTKIGDNAFGMDFDDEGNQIRNSGFRMNVTAGSAAEKYAKNNKIEHDSSGVDLKKLAFIVICIGLLVTAIVFSVVLMQRSKKSASRGAKKAHKESLEKEAEKNYKKITSDDDDDSSESENEDDNSNDDDDSDSDDEDE